ncbi:MAG: DUF4907 domain-containing protein [Chitinophagaceae bacterium]
MMLKLMATKKHNTIVIAVSIIISAAILITALNKGKTRRHIESRVFQLNNGSGWGYDILVNDSIVIHQESIPVLQHEKPFPDKEKAQKTADIVVQKMKNGEHLTLTKTDIDKILGADGNSNNQ